MHNWKPGTWLAWDNDPARVGKFVGHDQGVVVEEHGQRAVWPAAEPRVRLATPYEIAGAMGGKQGAVAFRVWLTATSVLRTHADRAQAVRQDEAALERWEGEGGSIRERSETLSETAWYSSVDTERIARELQVAHAWVLGWAAGTHIPDAFHAAKLAALGGPLAALWGSWGPPPGRKYLQTRCGCLSHRLLYACPDYETLEATARRHYFQLAAAVAGDSVCDERRGRQGPKELEDIAYVLHDWPEGISAAVWEEEAWARIAVAEGAPIPSRKKYRVNAAALGVSESTARNWEAGRTVPSLEQALLMQVQGGPPCTHWLEPSLQHRTKSVCDWSVFVPTALPASLSKKTPVSDALYPSQGMHQLRQMVRRQKWTLKEAALRLGTTRETLVGWMRGDTAPALRAAWRVTMEGGPPLHAWCTKLQVNDEIAVRSAEFAVLNVQVEEREKYREQARWAVARPVSGKELMPKGEALDAAMDAHRKRRTAAGRLLATAPGALEEWKTDWAPELESAK